jgi:hypothetical protein
MEARVVLSQVDLQKCISHPSGDAKQAAAYVSLEHALLQNSEGICLWKEELRLQ